MVLTLHRNWTGPSSRQAGTARIALGTRLPTRREPLDTPGEKEYCPVRFAFVAEADGRWTVCECHSPDPIFFPTVESF